TTLFRSVAEGERRGVHVDRAAVVEGRGDLAVAAGALGQRSAVVERAEAGDRRAAADVERTVVGEGDAGADVEGARGRREVRAAGQVRAEVHRADAVEVERAAAVDRRRVEIARIPVEGPGEGQRAGAVDGGRVE